MTKFIALTDHAKQRSIRRYGINEQTLLELAQKSILHGYSTGDAPNEKIKAYLSRKAKGDRKAYVYSGYIFIFSPDLVLITTFRMPRHYLMTLDREDTYQG